MKTALSAVLLAGIVVVFATSDARASDKCDPSVEGFFYNFGCDRIWDQRALERRRTLDELNASYTREKTLNGSLRQDLEVQRRALNSMKTDAAELERELQRLKQAQLTAQNAVQVLANLNVRAEALMLDLDIARVFCENNPNIAADPICRKIEVRRRTLSEWIEEIHSAAELAVGILKVGNMAMRAELFGEVSAETLEIMEGLEVTAETVEIATAVIAIAL